MALSDTLVTSLRKEIIASEKARIDLLKYKLLAVAGLGAVGIGVGSFRPDGGLLRPELVLALIPVVCVYVDLLCRHNTLRILVIAQFLKVNGDPYEGFLAKLSEAMTEFHKENVRYFFRLEDWALHWSTIFASLALAIWGLVRLLHSDIQIVSRESALRLDSLIVLDATFITIGLLGIFLAELVNLRYNKSLKRLLVIAPQVSGA